MARQVEDVTGYPGCHGEVMIGQASVVDVIGTEVPPLAEPLAGPPTQTVDPAVAKIVVVLLPRDRAPDARPRRVRPQAELPPQSTGQPERDVV